MTTVQNIFEYLCELAPLDLQMNFDNSGFLVGHSDAKVKTIIVALDVTNDVISEAEKLGAELIVSHHPVIFHPARHITDRSVEYSRVLALAENHIAVISMHTNLDIAAGGVNDALLGVFGLESEQTFADCGRIATLEKAVQFDEFVFECRKKLNVKGIRYHKATDTVKKLAVLGGAGDFAVSDVKKLGCDTYVTADVKHDRFIEASELGLNLIDADHFCTEWPIVPVLAERLSAKFGDVAVLTSKANRQIPDFA